MNLKTLFKRKPSKNKPFRQSATRYRLKRRSGNILRDVTTALLALAAVSFGSLVLVYAFSFLMSSPYLKVSEIQVRGCEEVSREEILSLAAGEVSRNILVADLRKVARAVVANPWVKAVSVGREYPNRLVIAVQERKPLALIRKDGDLFLMDGSGEAFKRLEGEDEIDMPVLTGFYREGGAVGPHLDKALTLLRFLEGRTEFPGMAAVSEINLDERQGLSLVTNTGLCLLLGYDHFENKFKRLPAIMADLKQRSTRTAFLRIDLSDPVKVTVQQRHILVPPDAAPSRARFKT